MTNDEESYRYLVESIRRFPRPNAFKRDGRGRRISCGPPPNRCWADSSTIHSRLEDLTTQRHPFVAFAEVGPDPGSPRRAPGIERDPLTPAPVRRLAVSPASARESRDAAICRRARLAIGPAAIKLGQALSTRPDLVGKEAAENLSQLQDDLPPAPSPHQADDREILRRSARELVLRFDEKPVGAASIAQVHRAVTTEGRDVAVKVLRPGIEDEFARAIETYEWAAAQVERYGRRGRAPASSASRRPVPQWTARELDLQREAASASELEGKYGRRARLSTSPRSTGGGRRAGC